MPDSQATTQFCYESLTCFHAWVRDLTDGEATLYSMLVVGALTALGWLLRQLWSIFHKKDEAMPSSENASTPISKTTANTINAERRIRLEEKLRQLYQQYDLETRVEEKMRLQTIIDQTQADLQAL